MLNPDPITLAQADAYIARQELKRLQGIVDEFRRQRDIAVTDNQLLRQDIKALHKQLNQIKRNSRRDLNAKDLKRGQAERAKALAARKSKTRLIFGGYAR